MISIIMPLYNGIEFLNDSITSIIKQSYREWELLIGVNGHTEDGYNNILDIVMSYSLDKIKVFQIHEKGKIKTLNLLVENAQYDCICLMDADDYWFPEKLTKQLLFFDIYDVIGTDCAYFGNKLGTPGLFLGKLSYKMFSFQNPIINSSAMIRKSDAWWDESWEGLDDYNLWLHLINKQKTFYNVSEILINHRIYDASCYNNINEDLHKKLLEEKVPKLDDEEYQELVIILDHQKWEL